MRPWSIGGAYDRPIPRRIAEEAGVPRDLFGQNKMATFNCWLNRDHAMSDAGQRDFDAFCDARLAKRPRPNALERIAGENEKIGEFLRFHAPDPIGDSGNLRRGERYGFQRKIRGEAASRCERGP